MSMRPSLDETAALIAAARAQGRSTLSEPDAKTMLRALGIPVPPGRLVRDAAAAAAAVAEIGPPVVAKAVARGLTHKTEAGGVIFPLATPAAAEAACRTIAKRVADYDPAWLDHLFLSGELVWGRLRPPKRDESDGQGMAALTRGMPISLTLREDLSWLLPDDRPDVAAFAGGSAQEVLNALRVRGECDG